MSITTLLFVNGRTHTHTHTQLIQDHVLFIMVGVLVVIDIVFMTFVTAFQSSRLTLTDRELLSNVRTARLLLGCLQID